jgi:hypothetical protein
MSYGMREKGDYKSYGVVFCDTQTEDSLYMRERINRNDILSIVLNLLKQRVCDVPHAYNINVPQHQASARLQSFKLHFRSTMITNTLSKAILSLQQHTNSQIQSKITTMASQQSK